MRRPIPATWSRPLLSLMRVGAGVLILMHGTQKVLGWPSSTGGGGQPVLSLFWTAGVIEILAGTLLILGLFSRLAALVLAGEMAYAFLFVHATSGSVLPILNGGEPAMLNLLIFLYLAAAGPGPYALQPDTSERPRPRIADKSHIPVVD